MFQLGQKITITEDREGNHPKLIGHIKRQGVGAWRLKGTSWWFKNDTGQGANYSGFAREYREGDEERLVLENARRARVAELNTLIATEQIRHHAARSRSENALRRAKADIARHRLTLASCLSEIARLEVDIPSYEALLASTSDPTEHLRAELASLTV